jgi:diadenylate cyclase
LRAVHKKRAYFTLIGFGVVFLVYILSNSFGLLTLNWVLDGFFKFTPLVLVLLFQEDIKKWLANLYLFVFNPNFFRVKSGFWPKFEETIKILLEKKVGTFICFDKHGFLNEYYCKGIRLGAPYSSELLNTILAPSSSLREGAIILSADGTIEACSVIFPFKIEEDISNGTSSKIYAAKHISSLYQCVALVTSASEQRLVVVKDGHDISVQSAQEGIEHIRRGLET